MHIFQVNKCELSDNVIMVCEGLSFNSMRLLEVRRNIEKKDISEENLRNIPRL